MYEVCRTRKAYSKRHLCHIDYILPLVLSLPSLFFGYIMAQFVRSTVLGGKFETPGRFVYFKSFSFAETLLTLCAL